MAGVYIDTSALGRVLLAEPDRDAILRELDRFERHISSRLLGVELKRLALRHGLGEAADRLLAAVALVPLGEGQLTVAESVPPKQVATLDAIHLVVALELAAAGLVDALLTYDARLASGASHHGLAVRAPV